VAEFLVRFLRHAPDDGLPDSAQQVGGRCGVDHILHELADVEVQGDEIVGALHLTLGQLVAHGQAAAAAFDVFAPSFGGQRAALAGGRVEDGFTQVVAALEHPRLGVFHAGLHKVRQARFRHDIAGLRR
jgi:hypothetical protein